MTSTQKPRKNSRDESIGVRATQGSRVLQISDVSDIESESENVMPAGSRLSPERPASPSVTHFPIFQTQTSQQQSAVFSRAGATSAIPLTQLQQQLPTLQSNNAPSVSTMIMRLRVKVNIIFEKQNDKLPYS